MAARIAGSSTARSGGHILVASSGESQTRAPHPRRGEAGLSGRPVRSGSVRRPLCLVLHRDHRERGAEPVQLLSRYWNITDGAAGAGSARPGVVGAQPVIAPGESFQYTSGCPLETASGTMSGRYQMMSARAKLRGGNPGFPAGKPLRAPADPLSPLKACGLKRRSALCLTWRPPKSHARFAKRRRPTRPPRRSRKAVRTLLRWAGDDPAREGLATRRRASRAPSRTGSPAMTRTRKNICPHLRGSRRL
jgi:hypothetical protein